MACTYSGAQPQSLEISKLPNWILSLAFTIAPFPIAVALDKVPVATSALYPTAVLFDPVVLPRSAPIPVAVL
jgi:hypothetical protein